ncbi:hypothetical protein BG006_001969 [Podila minutissima]|uniref:Uncharacterized protein n=1 Tax=Podila minutissima TaxID=64525 RepID=A0A9P5SSS1_9FUNG|nr:hypothetical protein BG006_001969 [Podila minutissima]
MIIQEIPPFRGRRNDALGNLSPYKKIQREQELPRFHEIDTVKSDLGIGPERGSGRYVLWSDIKRMFANVTYLEENGARVLFEVDNVISPLLIRYSETPYVVVTKQHELSQLDTRGIIRSNSLRSTGSVRSMASQHSNNNNDSMSRLSSTIITHHHSIPQVTRHYLSYKDLHRTLDSAKLCPRNHFLKTMANMDYHHNMLCFRTNQLGNIPLAKAVQQGLDQMQDQVQALDHYACQMDLFNRSLVALKSAHRQLEFAIPRLFLVFPHELDQWSEHDQSTHRFRLYFLCDFNYRNSAQGPPLPSPMSTIPPQHVHLVDHRGYDLVRPHEFFGFHGAYALRMLEMTHHGFAHDTFAVPPLATFHTLDSPGVTPPLARHNLTRTNFRPLVHKAIAYLRQLPPGGGVGGRPWTAWLSVEETRHVRSFLCRTDRFDHGMGGLCRTACGADALWLCQGHAHTQASVFRFREFVQRHRGVSDLQLGRLSLRIGSRAQAQELVAALQLAPRCVHDVSVRFEMEPEGREGLGWFVEDVARSGVRVLQLDGVTTRTHPQTRIWCKEDTFLNAVADTGLELVTLLKYPCQGVQSVYLEPLKDCRYRLQAEMATTMATATATASSSRLDIAWEKLFVDLRQFEQQVLVANSTPSSHSSSSPRLTPDEFSIVLDILSHRLRAHGADTMALTSVDIFDKDTSSWQARIGIHQGCVQGVTETFVVNSFLRPEILQYGTLRRLLVQAQDSDVVPYMDELMARNVGLETIEMNMQESALFARVADVCTRRHMEPEQLVVKVFDDVEDHGDRELVAMVVRKQAKEEEQVGEDGGPQVMDVLHWNCDYVPHATKDRDVALLDLASKKFPTVMISFTLDVSGLTAQGLYRVQCVLQQSSLEILHVRCLPIAREHRNRVGLILRAVQWSTIKSLVLSGSHIDDWLDLWVSDGDLFAAETTRQGPKLVSLDIKGTGAEEQVLSHASALAIHRLVYECPLLVVLWLNSFELPSDSDWDLILSAVDVEVLVTLGLPDINPYCQGLLDQVAMQWEEAGLM